MTPPVRVVVTGLGSVSAAGFGRAALAAALAGGRPHSSEVDRSAGYHRPGSPRLACLVEPAGLAPWVTPREARRMSPPSKLAAAAARMAVEDAGLDAGELRDGVTGVAVATSYGPSSYTERLLQQILREGPEAASPFLFTESVANAPAAQIALAFGAVGPNLTITQRDAGPLTALLRGAREIAAGRARRMLVAAVEEVNPLLHAVLGRHGALAGRRGGEEVARPFDRCRDGFLAAEGAAVLLLEAEEAVRESGRRPLARVRAFARAFDPGAPATGWGRDAGALAASLRRGLERSGVGLGEVDRVVAGASGSPAGDRLEALALRAAWGDLALPPVLAPKAVTGEHGGALLAAGVLAAFGEPFGATPGFEQVDPELALAPHDGRPLDAPARVLVSSLGVGGSAAWAVLDAPET